MAGLPSAGAASRAALSVAVAAEAQPPVKSKSGCKSRHTASRCNIPRPRCKPSLPFCRVEMAGVVPRPEAEAAEPAAEAERPELEAAVEAAPPQGYKAAAP